ncbi:MAG TPA: hypothetical protein EYG02_03980 [Henriciella marina]|uniref:histidine kinase dimerization/phosphoacceptor domain -containing protein n=1 Tax=Henriciella sp. TaxID=1968823 RepID=UPI0017CA4D0F|nr:histidine kinase dimerization/phosphoacceptor domain -containing protein [Henriciella sp.]HIG22815.1 hypothetical protein [Henriciella sp.]HIK64173.1 hypothetical protein [Henriciella marina]
MAADLSPFSEWADLFDVSKEALLLIDEQGRVLLVNPALRRMVKGAKPGSDFGSFLAGGEEVLKALVASLRSSAEPRPFSVTIKDAAGDGIRLRGMGKRLRRPGDEAYFTLRFGADDNNNFAALSLKVADLDREVRARRAAQQSAEAALEINRLLTKELHHRVNNNLQLQISLLRRSARLAANAEIKSFVEHAIGRLRAMSAGLDLTYRSGETGVDIADLTEKLARQAAEILPAERDIDLSLEAGFTVSVPQVTPLALIIHETMTRIFVAGDVNGEQRITLTADQDEHGPWLELSDNGRWADVPQTGDPAEANTLIDTLAKQAGVSVLRSDEAGRRLRLRFVAAPPPLIGQ